MSLRLVIQIVCVSYAAALMVVLLMPDPGEIPPDWVEGMGVQPDKFAHTVAYALMAILGGLSLPRPSRSALAWLLAGVTAHAVIGEVGQAASAHRQTELFDLAADALGIVVGLALFGAYLAGLAAWNRSRQPESA